MKYISIIILVALPLFCSAQIDSSVVNYITITGQYNSGEGVELRWFPSNRSVMSQGLKDGYDIERALAPVDANDKLEFKVIKHVKPYDQPTWNAAVSAKSMSGVARNFPDMADSFALSVVQRANPVLAIDAQATNVKTLKREEENEHGALMLTAVQDEETAKGLGIATVDETAVGGQTYVYRAKIHKGLKKVVNGTKKLGKLPVSTMAASKAQLANMKVVSVETIVSTKGAVKALKNTSVQVLEGDKRLSIQWNESPELAGYYIERSTSPDGKYEPVNTAPILRVSSSQYHGPKSVSVDDHDLENDNKYYYRVSANTLFGDKVVVAEVSGAPKDMTPPPAPFLEQPKTEDGKLILKWKNLSEMPKDFQGYNIYYSNDPKGEFIKINEKLISLRERSYQVQQFEERGSNYYKIEAVDINGNASQSQAVYAVILDETPPQKPSSIQASIDDQGNVQIVIPSQTDDDIVGYKIFKANQMDHEFIVVDEYFPNAIKPSDAIAYQEKMKRKHPKEDQAANTIDPDDLQSYEAYRRSQDDFIRAEDRLKEKYVFTEQIPLNTLTPQVFYKIKTYDRNHNQSEFSDPITIDKPDKVAPPKSVFKNVKNNIGNVEMKIIPAKAKDFDRIELSKKMANGQRWQIVQVFKELTKDRLLTYVDQEVEPGKAYVYRLQTVDRNGLRSAFSYTNAVQSINHKTIPEVRNVRAQRVKEQTIVNWSFDLDDESYFVIYRKVGDGPLRQVGRSEGRKFVDKKVPLGLVQYAVRPMLKDGNKGKISPLSR